MSFLSVIMLSALVALFAASGGYLVWRILDRDELHTLRDKVGRLENRLRELENRGEGEPPKP